MKEKTIYERFYKIYEYVSKHKGSYIFNTKLGKREVEICLMPKREIIFNYLDFDNTTLFCLRVNPDSYVEILISKIDELAIFSAIYELECIIYNIKHDKKYNLQYLLKYYNPPIGTTFWR